MKNPTITIKSISLNEIDIKFNFKKYDTEKPMIKQVDKSLNTKTKLTEHLKETKITQFSFVDESKKDHLCSITMKNFVNNKTLPTTTNINCFWCRNTFPYHPIGCPIDYKNRKVYKKYYSEITKTRYVLQESVTKNQMKTSMEMEQNNFELDNLDTNYYLIDGIFCSFNCCYAYILSNKLNPLYKNSTMYLKKLYYEMFKDSECKLNPAPDWRLLKEYGGELSIEDFRKNFYKIDYIDINDFTFQFPECKSVGMLFEKKIKL